MSGRDSYRGCLVAGAAGDALGYAVEFMGEAAIFGRYGEKGITGYELTHGKALISDDTQMTLFTAEGLLRAAAAGKAPGDVKGFAACVNEAYLDWLATQEEPYRPAAARGGSRLSGVPELYARRAPGNTCLSALRAGGGGTADRPINNSKGCGGVMRAAPVGLLQGAGWSDEDVCRLGAEAAAATHGHPLGWMSAAALALIVRAVSQRGAGVRDAALGALDTLNAVYAGRPERAGFTRLIERALELAEGDEDDLRAIHALGEGWVGDEALAIAVFCAARYSGDVDRALIAAVNHKGDSDSTGAIAGNIVGAQAGLSGIPEKYTKDLELLDVIEQAADDLYTGGDAADPVWRGKYPDSTYRPERANG